MTAAGKDRHGPFFLGKGRVVLKRTTDVTIELDASSLLGACTITVPRRAFQAQNEVFQKPGGGTVVVEHWYAVKRGWVTE